MVASAIRSGMAMSIIPRMEVTLSEGVSANFNGACFSSKDGPSVFRTDI